MLWIFICRATYPSQENFNCSILDIERNVEFIKKNYQTMDIESQIEEIRNGLSLCGLKLEYFGISELTLNQMKLHFPLNQFVNGRKEFFENKNMDLEQVLSLAMATNSLTEEQLFKLKSSLTSALNAEKARCSPVDYREKLPPIREQDDIGWCYAYSAADLASFHLGRNVSAFDMALQYNHSRHGIGLLFRRRESDREGGRTKENLELGLNRGFCLEENLPSRSLDGGSIEGSLELIEDLTQDFSSRSAPFYNVMGSDEAAMNDIAGQIACENFDEFRKMFPFLDEAGISNLISNSTMGNIIYRAANESCGKRIKLNKTVIGRSINENSLMDAHELLSSGNIFSISYRSEILKIPRYQNPSADYDHVSTIVGRRWNQNLNRCEFLLRNSYGERCFRWYQNCEDGYHWVGTRNLWENSINMDSLE